MIRIHKDFDTPPPGLTTDACNGQKQKALAERATHTFSSYHYRDSTITVLKRMYNHKCGYCETKESAGAALRVDHYRPKARVKNVPDHEGYYWLAYEWTNLILSCEKCNGKKLDQFPLENEASRVSKPVIGVNNLPLTDCCRVDGLMLREEHPLLLNPELDSPDDHLIFRPNGTIQAKTIAGATSIDVYHLERDELIISRKKMTDIVVEKIDIHLLRFLRGEITEATYRYAMFDLYEEASMGRRADKPHSHVANALFENFDEFVTTQFPTHQQSYIKQSIALYLDGRLWPMSRSIGQ